MILALLLQVGKALAYYIVLVVLMRLAGKRLAGQTTTFDLIILISLAVAIQSATLAPGTVNAVLFAATVFIAHHALTFACAKSAAIRHFVRGQPRTLVRDGEVLNAALQDEGITLDELLAGLRKLGHESIAGVRLAVLEETGHISAVARDPESARR